MRTRLPTTASIHTHTHTTTLYLLLLTEFNYIKLHEISEPYTYLYTQYTASIISLFVCTYNVHVHMYIAVDSLPYGETSGAAFIGTGGRNV